MNLNSSPSPTDQHHQALNLHQAVSSASSSSPSPHFFFSSTQDHMGFYLHQCYQPHHQQDDSYTYHGGSSYEIKNKVDSSLKLALWKKEDQLPAQKHNQVKWISSKNNDRISPKLSIATAKSDVQPPLSSFQTDISSNSSPIRVCSDCHTTKTPLWRSGPKGPKSLCNACGIRQRKARRAMAEAAATANSTVVASDVPRPMKMKVQYKETMAENGHLKRCRMGGGSLGNKKVRLEDLLVNLSNKLAVHRVFPQDEKDAAILLMALSHG